MTGPAARTDAQAKINLHLRVFGKNPSGYHSIQTLFHRIDFSDCVTVRVGEAKRRLDVQGADIGAPESNLAYRAAVDYANSAGWPRGFTIELEKRVPIGGGLGGGSADAAAVLRLLNFLADRPLPSEDLMAIASGLGADVPFLLTDHVMAMAWGRGDRMRGLPALPQRQVLLVVPGIPVSTAEAYAWLDEDRRGEPAFVPPEPASETNGADPFGSWDEIAEVSSNDFITSVVARHPELGELLAELRHTKPLLASMPGSGSTLFGIYEEAPALADTLVHKAADVIRTRTSTSVVQPIRLG